jgi:ubiquinone biosynthesis protein
MSKEGVTEDRLNQVLEVLFKNELGILIAKTRLKDRLNLNQRLKKDKFSESNIQPQNIKRTFQELGKTFKIFSKFLSTRYDLLPSKYIEEFKKIDLKENPSEFEEIKTIIESELKKPLKETFKEIDQKAVCSNLTHQTHRAILTNGEKVLIKVQKPGCIEKIRKDIEILVLLTKRLQEHNENIDKINPVNLIKEFQKWIKHKLNLEKQALNLQIIRNNNLKNKSMIIPLVFDEASTKKILTYEYIEGIKLNDDQEIEKIDNIEESMKNLSDNFLRQSLIQGTFSNINKGNVKILRNNIPCSSNIEIDSFDDKTKEDIIDLIKGIIKQNTEGIIQSLENIGLDGINTPEIKEELENALQTKETIKLEDIVLSQSLKEIFKIIMRHGLKPKNNLILFTNALINLENTSLRYNPSFKITNLSNNLLNKIITRKNNREKMSNIKISTKNITSQIPEKTKLSIEKIKEVIKNMKYIDRDIRSLMNELDRSSNRIMLGLIIASLVIASTMMLSYKELTILNISAFSFIGYSLSALLIMIIIIAMLKERNFN